MDTTLTSPHINQGGGSQQKSPTAPDFERRSLFKGIGRGLRKNCPACGSARLFSGYVKTVDSCSACHLDISGHRADDAPPYLTIMIVGHILIPLALAYKQIFDPPLGLQFAIFLPLMIISTFWLLPIMKGAMIGLQWANRMHGFGDGDLADKSDA